MGTMIMDTATTGIMTTTIIHHQDIHIQIITQEGDQIIISGPTGEMIIIQEGKQHLKIHHDLQLTAVI